MPRKGSGPKTRAQGAATPNKDSVQESSHGSEGRFGNSPSDPGRSGSSPSPRASSRDSVPYGEEPAVADGMATSGRDGRMQVGSPTVGAYAETVRAGGAGALPSRLADRAAPMGRGYPAGEIGQDDHGEQSPDKMDQSRGEESPDKVDHTQLVTPLCKDPQRERAEEWARKEEECERREALLARERALLMEELQVLRLSEQVRQARSGSPPPTTSPGPARFGSGLGAATMGTRGPQQADAHLPTESTLLRGHS